MYSQTTPQPPTQPAPPTPVGTGYVTDDPGKTLGIISLVTSLLGIGVVGLVTGIVGRSKSKAAGHSNGMALAGIIISAISIVVGLIIGIILVLGLVVGLQAVTQKCNELGPGTHYEGSAKYTCGVDGNNSIDIDESYADIYRLI